MSIVIGIWFAVAGGVALLAGVTAMRRADRLRLRGVPAWATVVTRAGTSGDFGKEADRTLIRFPLADGRQMELTCPVPVRRERRLIPGEMVRIWYDRLDPAEVLVSGFDKHYVDWAFAITGALLILAGTGIARFGP
jgi:Protein of unknown function (DUF3592)